MFYTLIVNYIAYWYGAGLIRLLKYFRAWIIILTDTFSVKTSLLTLLSPWRRDVGSMEGLPLDKKVGVVIMNVVSRFFGAFIKLITLSVYLISLTVLFVVEACILLIWIGLPVITFGGIVLGSLVIIAPNG